jgi:thiol-disulfide isomerase/thioredoxin
MSLLVALLALSLQTVSQSPQDCIKAGRDFSSKRMKELGATTAENVRQVTAERLAMLQQCAAQFDAAKVPPADLAPLIDLYLEAQQTDLARSALAAGLAIPSLEPADKGKLLLGAVRMTLRLPKSAARNADAERYVDQLDALGEAALEQRFSAHAAMNGYYRADDIDAGIIKHSNWIIDTGSRFSPELRKKYSSSVISAYVNLAEAVAGQGENDRALELLNRAITEWTDSPAAASRFDDVLRRYKLVGTAAPAVSAAVWLNREATAPMDLKGKVTLLQFTAHWCGPCKESYPGMKRLLERFSKEKFQTVFSTRTYGYFESERPLTAEQEIERDKKYFAGYGFTIPIAVGTPSSVVVDGKTLYKEDPLEAAFAVGGIPQINVIDTKGRIRLVMIGYDDANEEKLAAFIEKLLREKIPDP